MAKKGIFCRCAHCGTAIYRGDDCEYGDEYYRVVDPDTEDQVVTVCSGCVTKMNFYAP